MCLSKSEVVLLTKQWRKDDFDWLYNIGKEIYTVVFEMCPRVKSFFPYVLQCDRENKEWQESHEFRRQALRFVQVLSHALDHFENAKYKASDTELRDLLRGIGFKHRAFSKIGFRPTHWQIFVVAAVKALMKDAESLDVDDAAKVIRKTAWEKLTSYVVSCMEEGYYSDSTERLDR
ncbi:unnamed protein product [Soboliphyme baturini]|uniref:GLOBIN domain-containing protein n=1 Tax=Soboliphyme baturini TaxID=241478 RepID=A0A183IT50_9BILA|nr:unnamed protein product [Soboliphyme baturini]